VLSGPVWFAENLGNRWKILQIPIRGLVREEKNRETVAKNDRFQIPPPEVESGWKRVETTQKNHLIGGQIPALFGSLLTSKRLVALKSAVGRKKRL
jgi:hypothetical protein